MSAERVSTSNTKKGAEAPNRLIIYYFCIVMIYKQLTLEQRYGIYLGLQNKMTQKAIAQLIGLSASTVSREIKRNRNKRGKYGWTSANGKAMSRREVCSFNSKIDVNVLHTAINLLKSEDWSPRQISGYLKLGGILISHETIYN